MKYTDAKQLRSGDEIVAKETGEILRIMAVIPDKSKRDIVVICEDDCWYHYRDIRHCVN